MVSNIWKHGWTTVAGFLGGSGVWEVLHASCGVNSWAKYLAVLAPVVIGAIAKDPHKT